MAGRGRRTRPPAFRSADLDYMAGQKKPGPKAGVPPKAGVTKPPAAETIDGKVDEPKKKKSTSPFEFARQVRSELSKVTWTSRNETLISTIMVLIMVVIMAIFFLGVDAVLRFGVCSVLPIECASR